MLLNEQSQRVRGRRSINQVHQKRIRSVSVRRSGPKHGGGQAERQQSQEGRKQGEMGGRMGHYSDTLHPVRHQTKTKAQLIIKLFKY